MNKRMRDGLMIALAATSGVLGFGSGKVCGQGDAAVPAVRLEPGVSAHWSMVVKQESPKGEAGDGKGGTDGGGEIAVDTGEATEKAAVVRSEYVVTGQTGRAVTSGGGGKRREIYMFRHEGDTLLFTWSESGRRVTPYLLDQYVGPEMRFSRRYPGVDWVRPADYRGLVEFRGRSCHHFAMAANMPSPKERAVRADALAYDPRMTPSPREAWFDAETGLPVAFRDGTSNGRYRHYDAPGEAVKLPDPYTVALKYYYGAGSRPKEIRSAPVTAPDPPEMEEEEDPEGKR